MYDRVVKRFFDIVLSGAAMLLLSPVYLVVAVLVRIRLGAPVLFFQERPGKQEKIFRMYKFRSMTEERDGKGELLPDAVRLTKFGRLLRSTSLDELPELWNIFKGDMSLVGPRPLLVQYLAYYNEEQKHRHDVRPGLTGLAQVHGRNAISWEEKFAWDVKYVREQSFLLDLRILWMTAGKVLKREDINQEGSATMAPFTGTKKEK